MKIGDIKFGESKKNIMIEKIIEEMKEGGKILSEYEENMILNIIKLSNISVRDIMVPRVDLHSIDIKASIEEVVAMIQEKGISRIPVFDEEYDNVLGILHAKDLMKYVFNKEQFVINEILREPYFVPEIKPINDLLVEFRENKIHLSIVVDEYGGISGIVCLEDIIERIVGDIKDEFDKEGSNIIQIDEKSYLVNGRINIDDLNEAIGTNFDEDDVDTVGGLIYMILGRIPKQNEVVRYHNYIFTIAAISGRKIKLVRIEKEIDSVQVTK